MRLKNVAFIVFVTTILLSTGFILYFNAYISTPTMIKLRKHTIIKTVVDDGEKDYHIGISLPGKFVAPNMVKTTGQIEIASTSSLSSHKQQHSALNHATKVTGKGITKAMEITRSTASEEFKHVNLIKSHLRSTSVTTTSPIYYRHSSSSTNKQLQRGDVIKPRLRLSSGLTTTSPIYYRHSSSSTNKQLQRGDVIRPRLRSSFGLTTTSPKHYKSSNPIAMEQFELGDVIKPHLRSSPGETTTLPAVMYYRHNKNTVDRGNIGQPNHVPMHQNWRAFSRKTFSRNSTGYAASLYGQQSMQNLSPQKRHFWTKLYRLVMVRKLHANVLEMSRNVCTKDTCLLPQDPFPKEVEEDIFLEQAKCLSTATFFLNVTRNTIDNTLKKCTCHLQSNVTKRIGLVSTPGSGNTWVRGLLEQITEICTGSLWCDGSLRATHFCAEGLRSTSTLIVKNHDPMIRWRGQRIPKSTKLDYFSDYNKPEFDAVIFVIRDPFHSLVAEHNRALAHSLWKEEVERNRFTTLPSNAHVQFFGYEYFYNNNLWDKMLYKRIDNWGQMVQHLLVDSKNNHVLLVHYENLKSNLIHEMKRMMEFLDYNITEDRLRERLDQKFTAFYRNHTAKFEHFTSEQKDYVNSVIASKVEAGLPLKQYIRP